MVKTLRIGHSPDADDAFMFYGFARHRVELPGYRVVQHLEDIESLNRRALHGELEVTAISAAVYPHVSERYQIMRAGASIGRGYGPKVLTREPRSLESLRGETLAVPGEYTTAFLVLRLIVPDIHARVMDFQAIPSAVARGEVPAGLVIHESQLTFAREGLHQVLDLGLWWLHQTRLPLPLGLDVVRRDLPEADRRRIRETLQESIRTAYREMDQALDYALEFGRGLDRETGERFVRMYVNDDTLDMGEEGRRALVTLFEKAWTAGLIPAVPPVDLI